MPTTKTNRMYMRERRLENFGDGDGEWATRTEKVSKHPLEAFQSGQDEPEQPERPDD